MTKILSVVGTRPETIKMAPVIKELQKHSDKFICRICVTAQHRQMIDPLLSLFNIKPDYDLNLMEENQSLERLTATVLTQVGEIIKKEKPDCLLVQGDTTTTMAASLAAFYQKIPVGHIEAGLRTYNKYSPYPEELNRRITSVIAEYNFAPTKWAKDNLIKEGISEDTIYVTGNTVVDALRSAMAMIRVSDLQNKFTKMFDFLNKEKRLVLITGHRRESFGDGFVNICTAIKELALKFPTCEFLYPVHLNPNVQSPVKEILGKDTLPNVHLIEPLEYLPFIYLMSRAYLIITDSGGVQEEAPSFGKPVLVTRNTTERPEGVEAGVVKLAGNSRGNILIETSKLLNNKHEYLKMSAKKNLYGDGKSAKRIVDIVIKKLKEE